MAWSTVMFWLYSGFVTLLLPLAFLRLWRKGRKNTAYRCHWSERLGLFTFQLDSCIWLHAVSLGEMVAAAPLIQALLDQYPAQKLFLSCMTPTGHSEAQKWATQFPGRVFVAYLPYDTPLCLKPALKRIKPRLLIVMETELWPNLFRLSKVPVIIVNARISDRALPRYTKIRALMPFIFKHVTEVAAQSEIDAERFRFLGAPHVSVMGNIKYDLPAPQKVMQDAESLKKTWNQRLIITAGSTHEGEENLLLDAYQSLKARYPELLLVLIPRHPERFQRVAALCEERHLSCLCRSKEQAVTTEDILLVDTMGEVKTFYALADLVFVGGSLVPIGGHNILEAAILKKPIIVGPYMQNARKVVADFLAADALVQVKTPADLTANLQSLLENQTLGQNLAAKAQALMVQNRGALTQLLKILAKYQ